MARAMAQCRSCNSRQHLSVCAHTHTQSPNRGVSSPTEPASPWTRLLRPASVLAVCSLRALCADRLRAHAQVLEFQREPDLAKIEKMRIALKGTIARLQTDNVLQ